MRPSSRKGPEAKLGKRRTKPATAATLVLAVLFSLVVAQPAHAALPVETPGCSLGGTDIDHSFKLGGDVTCGANQRWIFLTKSNIVVDLGGFTVDGADPAGYTPAIHAGDTNGTTIRNGVVQDFAQGIQMAGSDMLVENMRFASNTGTGIIATSTGGVVRDSVIVENGSNGIFANQTDNLFVGNLIAANVPAGVAVLNGAVTVKANVIRENSGPGIDINSGVPGPVKVIANTITDNGLEGIVAATAATPRIVANDLARNDGAAISFPAVVAPVIKRNTISSEPGEQGITAQGSDINDAVIAGNRVSGGSIGIDWNGDDVKISGNVIAGTSAEGIQTGGDDMVLTTNRVFGAVGAGITVSGVGPVVQANRVKENGTGLIVSIDTTSGRIIDNVASGNDIDGISVSGPKATIDENTANHNGFDGGGLGIDASGVTTVKGKNRAIGNADPDQCDPTSLC